MVRIVSHGFLAKIGRVLGHLREHVRFLGIDEEVNLKGLLFGDKGTQWAATAARKDSEVLEAEACAPEWIEVSTVVFADQLGVDVIAEIKVVTIATWEQDAIDF